MRIVSVIRRKAGTDVVFDGVEYRFRPEVEGDHNSLHVAEVDREDHVQRFLAIPEGYKLHPDAFMPVKVSREAELLDSVELLTVELAERDKRIAALQADAKAETEELLSLVADREEKMAELTDQLDKMTAPAPAPAPEGHKPQKRK